MALLFGALGIKTGFAKAFLAALAILLPSMHYYTYHWRYPGEYYFYQNLGITPGVLWSLTLAASLISLFIALF